MLYDPEGEGMTPSHAVKRGRRYRYYVSRSLMTRPSAEVMEGCRVPAADVERLVVERIQTFMADRSAVFDALSPYSCDVMQQSRWTEQARQFAVELSSGPTTERHILLRKLVERVQLHPTHLEVHLGVHRLLKVLSSDDSESELPKLRDKPEPPLVLTAPACLKRVGKEMRLLFEGPDGGRSEGGMNASLIALVVRAHAIKRRLLDEGSVSLAEMAREDGVDRSYLSRMARLAYLAPDITAAILNGRQPLGLNAKILMKAPSLPLDWRRQRHLLGFAQSD